MKQFNAILMAMVFLVVFIDGSRAMSGNEKKIEAIKEKLKIVDLSDGISKEEAVIIVQNHLIDEGYNLKGIKFFNPKVIESGIFNKNVVTKEEFKNVFINGEEIFDWLMKNEYFVESSGIEGHPKEVSKKIKETLESKYHKDGYRIFCFLELAHDCWSVIFNTSFHVSWNQGLKWLAVDVDKKTGKIRSEGEGPSF
jgi:hypothetical protein